VKSTYVARCLSMVLLAAVLPASASTLFDDSAVVEVRLIGPLSSLIENENAAAELPFMLHADGVEHAIQVQLRGNSRRRMCSFPPLRLTFQVDNAVPSIFAGQGRLKLVTHCRDSKAAQSAMLREYAAYRIFNLISNASFRVRLLHITYTDTDGGLEKPAFDRYGFVVESTTELADRMGGKPARVTGVSLPSLDSQQAASVFVFQYLIGNTDWSLVMADGDDKCCHNGDLIEIAAVRYYVPYDFDLSGLVNASYARPDPSLLISRVTQRLYRGYCIPRDAVQEAISRIEARRVDVLDVIPQLPALSQKEVAAAIKYLEQFFARANDRQKMVQLFERSCL